MSTVIDLSVGHIRPERRHRQFIVLPSSEYGSADGAGHLRDALAAMHSVPPECVVVTTGSSLAITALLATRRARRLLLPRPFYPSFVRTAELLGIRCEFYQAVAPGGGADVDSAVAAMRANPTGILLWNYPHNPTGVLDSENARTVLRSVAAETGCELILDCVYADLVYSDYDPPAGLPAESESRVYSLSKALAFAGERIGYVVAAPSRCAEVARAHWALAMSPPLGSQSMALELLTTEPHYRADLLEQLRGRRELAREILGACPFVACEPPAGGIFLWIDVPGSGISSVAISEICRRVGLIVQPGSHFGVDSPPAVRASLAVARDDLTRGLSILVKIAERLAGHSAKPNDGRPDSRARS